MLIQLEFVGHACFRIWQDGQPIIVTDPYLPEDIGISDDGKRLEARTVIMSSATDDSHSNYKLVSGNPHVINALDIATEKTQETINGEPVIAIPAAEGKDHPTGADANAVYAFKVGDLWFAHLGDLGFGLSEEQLQPWVGKCDVLLAITGEKYTLDLNELDAMIAVLKPKVIFPMHYQLLPAGKPMTPVSAFLERRKYDPVIFVRDHTVVLPIQEIKRGRPTIVVLEPSGYTPDHNVF